MVQDRKVLSVAIIMTISAAFVLMRRTGVLRKSISVIMGGNRKKSRGKSEKRSNSAKEDGSHSAQQGAASSRAEASEPAQPKQSSYVGGLFNRTKEFFGFSEKDWESVKEEYLNMPISEKRHQYLTSDFCEYKESMFEHVSSPTPGEKKTPFEKIAIWKGDITTLEFDAIVNAANERMRGGGGVDGAIHRAAGHYLLKESISCYPDGCRTGEAKLTGGYRLPAKYVIHTVGPRFQSQEYLTSCYESVLQIVKDKNFQTVAIPCISTGIFGYPNEAAAKVALSTVLQWLKKNQEWNGRIVFCVFLPIDEKLYRESSKVIFAELPSGDSRDDDRLQEPSKRGFSSEDSLPGAGRKSAQETAMGETPAFSDSPGGNATSGRPHAIGRGRAVPLKREFYDAGSRKYNSNQVEQTKWQDMKEKYLNMPLEEKQAKYQTRKYQRYDSLKFQTDQLAEAGICKTLLKKIGIWRGDITTLEIDAIVNAANERMRGGGGVDGAIHRAAGDYLMKESISCYPNGCRTGEAKLTGGYRLPAKYVIHTVGPRNQERHMLEKCYQSVLQIVKDKSFQTVAIPCISTGIFGYPNDEAADVALTTTLKWLEENPEWKGRIIFCVFLDADELLYDQLSEIIFASHVVEPIDMDDDSDIEEACREVMESDDSTKKPVLDEVESSPQEIITGSGDGPVKSVDSEPPQSNQPNSASPLNNPQPDEKHPNIEQKNAMSDSKKPAGVHYAPEKVPDDNKMDFCSEQHSQIDDTDT